MMRRRVMAAFAVSCLAAGVASANGPERIYEVTVTNLTKGQSFTPFLGALHRPGVSIFELGEPAGGELEALAEAGDTAPMTETLEGLGPAHVGEVVTAPGLLGPGETRVFEVLRLETDRASRRAESEARWSDWMRLANAGDGLAYRDLLREVGQAAEA